VFDARMETGDDEYRINALAGAKKPYNPQQRWWFQRMMRQLSGSQFTDSELKRMFHDAIPE
jgi:hypothetical protein